MTSKNDRKKYLSNCTLAFTAILSRNMSTKTIVQSGTLRIKIHFFLTEFISSSSS